MERLARLVMHHRRIVSAFWLLLFIAGAASASQLSGRLTVDFSLPGQPGDAADHQLIETYGTSSFDTYLAVLTVPTGETVQADQAKIAQIFGAVKQALPVSRVVDYQTTGDKGFVSDDGRTTYALIQGPLPQSFGPGIETKIEPALTAGAKQAGFTSGLTSYGLLSAGGDSGGPSVLVETLLGGAGALLVLIFVFASFLALVPLVIAGVSILTCFLLVLGLTTFSDVSFVVQFLIALIGLGVAIDYSLLVVSRWREERAHGRDNEEAVVVAMKTAGHAVFASGVTVAISLVALLVVPVPFLRSMGIGGMLIPLVSVAVVLTLLPALLSSFGPRIDYPRIRREATASRGWSAWARAIVRRRFVAAGVALVALALLIVPVFSLKIGQSGIASLARNGPAYTALQTLRSGGFGSGVLTPVEVLVPASQADAAVQAAGSVDGVQMAVIGGMKDGQAVVDVLPTSETVDSSSSAVVDQIRSTVEDSTSGPVGVTGAGAIVEDYFSAVYDNFPYVLALIAAITFI
ncbi:MAG: MMPL family transporter, partial [Actinomycetota bacterium]|nr:MMPL family transporter [Actinomycetota bacterium]